MSSDRPAARAVRGATRPRRGSLLLRLLALLLHVALRTLALTGRRLLGLRVLLLELVDALFERMESALLLLRHEAPPSRVRWKHSAARSPPRRGLRLRALRTGDRKRAPPFGGGHRQGAGFGSRHPSPAAAAIPGHLPGPRELPRLLDLLHGVSERHRRERRLGVGDRPDVERPLAGRCALFTCALRARQSGPRPAVRWKTP